jgi:hypothetical protein
MLKWEFYAFSFRLLMSVHPTVTYNVRVRRYFNNKIKPPRLLCPAVTDVESFW